MPHNIKYNMYYTTYFGTCYIFSYEIIYLFLKLKPNDALSLLKAILSPIKIAVKNKNEDIFNRLIESGAGIP